MDRFAFKVNQKDNVATALTDICAGQTVTIRGEEEIGPVLAKEEISLGHKIAIEKVKVGEDIIKFGVSIGRATREIEAGFWVHTHNMVSKLDTRLSKD